MDSISFMISETNVRKKLLHLPSVPSGTAQTCNGISKFVLQCLFTRIINVISSISCRREQAIYDACMEKKLKAAKAPFGYFSQIRIHETSRPKPAPFVPEFPNRSKGMPVDYEGLKEEARGGSRFYYQP